uniref:hypothetical protein n=1 Tax=Pelomonas sp. KK5 TaxID=1855730 RepID=UPI001E5E1F96
RSSSRRLTARLNAIVRQHMSSPQQNHDWLLFRGGAEFRRSSGCTEAKERDLLSTLCMFINEHGLSHKPLPVSLDQDWEGIEVRYSQLTELGQLVMQRSLSRWLAAIDRGTPPAKSKVLLRALEKIRGLHD